MSPDIRGTKFQANKLKLDVQIEKLCPDMEFSMGICRPGANRRELLKILCMSSINLENQSKEAPLLACLLGQWNERKKRRKLPLQRIRRLVVNVTPAVPME